MTVEQSTVFPQPGIPLSQRRDLGSWVQLLNNLLLVNQVPVPGCLSPNALIYFGDGSVA